MTASTGTHEMLVHTPPASLAPEVAPWIKWGQGTPAAIEPFTTAQKGSLYIQTDAADDGTCVWECRDEAGATTDWVKLSPEQSWVSKEFNIDNGSGTADSDVLVLDKVINIIRAFVFYTEATDTAGAEGANVAIGTAAAGAQLVAATALTASKAIGGKTALTLVTGAGAVAANGGVFITHTGIATTEAGKYKVVIVFH